MSILKQINKLWSILAVMSVGLISSPFLVLLTTTLLTLTPFNVIADDDLLVQTSTGPVRGVRQKSALGKEIDAFLGIPYAQPPLGENRFRHPKPVERWTDVFNASTLPNACVQLKDTTFGEDFRGTTVWNPNTPISEDCLKVNVWVPSPRPQGSPVMVWIHGGGWTTGSSALDIYDPRILSTENNVIIASFNYRLHSLGFLYLGQPDAPGNAAMFDQIMALEWIKTNIEHFGGDPERITIFGESAGAGSVGLHLFSKRSANLFNQAILESGSAIAPWSTIDKEESIERGLMLAKKVGCPSDRSQMNKITECLRTKDPIDLVNFTVGPAVIVNFPPIIDGVFLDELPSVSLETKNCKQAKILAGANANEGTYFLIYIVNDYFKNQEDINVNRSQFVDSVKQLLPEYNDIQLDSVIFQYTNWENPEDNDKNIRQIDYMYGDASFACPTNNLAFQYAKNGNDVYLYYFKHRSSLSAWPHWMGTIHGEEINFVFGEPLNPKFNYTEEEKTLSRRMMQYWTNFAKTGNPNLSEDNRHTSVEWPRHTVKNREYLTLDINSTETGKARIVKNCAFWKEYVPKLTNAV